LFYLTAHLVSRIQCRL